MAPVTLSDEELVKLKMALKPSSSDYKTFYNKIYVTQMSYTRGFLIKKTALYQSLYLIRLILFEPLYVAL